MNKLKRTKKLMILSGIMSLFFLLVILLMIPSNLNLLAHDKLSTNKSELNRVYHLEEDGYMLDNGDFVRISFSFVTEDDSGVQKLSKGRPYIRKSVTKILSGTDRDAFHGSQGLEWFENEIMNDLNQSFSDIDIERVYITGIIIT